MQDVGNEKRRKRVAVLGSSGGNLYSLGGDDPERLLNEIHRQLDAAGAELYRVQFVASSRSLDAPSRSAGWNSGGTDAALWSIDGGRVTGVSTGTLDEINESARESDRRIAEEIEAGEVDAVILVSSDPEDTNRHAVEQAALKGLPAAGTGGTSVSSARSKGLEVVAASGTTGTTNATRAVSYVSGLAGHWGMPYRPIIGSPSDSAPSEKPWRRIQLRSIMVSSLPAFIAMAIVLALSRIPGLGFFEEVFTLLIEALPIVVAVVAARKISGLDEIGMIAGVVAGVLSVEGGIIGGIVGGIIAGILASQLLVFTLARRFPATTANIVSGGLSGLAGGLVVYFAVAPLALTAGDGIRAAIEWAVAVNGILAGAIAGLLIWPAIIGGVYHAAILPVVLLEMENSGNSFFGAIDMVGLVMVAAGITLANIIYPRTRSERAMASSGFPINIAFGTFVEAAYPFMFADRMVFAGAILSAGAGGALVGFLDLRGTAYVPSVVAPFVSNNAPAFAIAMIFSALLSFSITLAANWRSRRKLRKIPA